MTEIRWRVAYSLSTATNRDPEIVQKLKDLLHDTDSVVRINAAETIHALEVGSTNVVDAAISLLEDRSRTTRLRAKRLILARKPLESQQMTRLRDLLRHDKSYVSKIARSTIHQLALPQ